VKTFISASLLALGMLAGNAQAANTSCDKQATEKKLAGAAKTSFLKKCESDAAAAAASAASGGTSGASEACTNAAAEKKLAGAAKTSYVKKCVADAEAAQKTTKK
jgi:hypothetical protein